MRLPVLVVPILPPPGSRDDPTHPATYRMPAWPCIIQPRFS